MDQLHAERPDDCILVRQTELHAEYTVPKKWVKIHQNRILSDEQKAEYAERAKRLAQYRKSAEQSADLPSV